MPNPRRTHFLMFGIRIPCPAFPRKGLGTLERPGVHIDDVAMSDSNNRKHTRPSNVAVDQTIVAPPAPSVAEGLDGIVQRRLTERSAAVTPVGNSLATEARPDAATTRRTETQRDAAVSRRQDLEDAMLGYPCPSAQAADVL